MQNLSVAAEMILRESNTLLDGQHFVYISGDHGAGWVLDMRTMQIGCFCKHRICSWP